MQIKNNNNWPDRSKVTDKDLEVMAFVISVAMRMKHAQLALNDQVLQFFEKIPVIKQVAGHSMTKLAQAASLGLLELF
jgi:hypothetical protein